MNVFLNLNGDIEYITRENYIRLTDKKYPYYQDAKKYKSPYFALCPACKNPIQIINLFNKRYIEKETNRKNTHGRHFGYDIEGLAKYIKINYDICIFSNPRSFELKEVRENETYNNDIKQIIESNRLKILYDIRKIIGVNLTFKKVSQLIDEYINANEYCYEYTNEFNIPYSILYTRHAINLFGQKLNSNYIGTEIENAINNKSKYYKVVENQVRNITSEYIVLDLIVQDHIVSNDYQSMNIVVKETFNGQTNIILKKKIELDFFLYKKS